MEADTINLWMSSGKPLTALAVARLYEAGQIDLDREVAHWIPAFRAAGKGAVTVRQLLQHTAGMRGADLRISSTEWDEIIVQICNAPLEPGWDPGKKAGYHVQSSWFILGEIVAAVSGLRIEDYLAEQLMQPLGMRESFLSLPPEEAVWLTDRVASVYSHSDGRPHREHNDPKSWTVPRPGGSMRGPIRELGLFYEFLLFGPGPGQQQVVLPETVGTFVSRSRIGMEDHTFQQVMDWGLGFIPDNKQYASGLVPYGYGPRSSGDTFGHGGAQSSVGFADPAHGLVVAIVFNHMPGEVPHQRRMWACCEALYLDLGL